MNQSIFFKKVLEQMELKTPEGLAVPFDISVREFSAQNSSGGKLKRYNDARLLVSKPKKNKGSLFHKVFSSQKFSRTPNHQENKTRNLELANGEIKKINIRFIIEFNGKKVVY